MFDRLLLLAIILAQWRRPMASSEALDLLHWAMHVVLYRHTATAIKMTGTVGACFHCCYVSCRPGGCRGNTKRVVARLRRPVASGIALDMLHWEMHFVYVAIKTAGRQRTFDCHTISPLS
jgi:hypothetical protein